MSPVRTRYPAQPQVGEVGRLFALAAGGEIAVFESLQQGCSKLEAIGSVWRRIDGCRGRRRWGLNFRFGWADRQAVDGVAQVARREMGVELHRDAWVGVPHDPLDGRQVGAG